jgi:hypothetical protein
MEHYVFTEVMLAIMVLLVEKERGSYRVGVKYIGKVSSCVLPPWLGGSSTTTTEWSSLLGMMFPFLMLGFMAVA